MEVPDHTPAVEEISQFIQEPETRLGINMETTPLKPENNEDSEAKTRKESIVLTANGTRTAVKRIQDMSRSQQQIIPRNSQVDSKNLPLQRLNRTGKRNLGRSPRQ